MSGPQPPFGAETLHNIVQFGGPQQISAASAATTFPTAFPDTNYMMSVEWVSGPPPTQGEATVQKFPQYCIQSFYGTAGTGAFKWQAWRLV